MTKTIPDTFDASKPKHVVGVDRGLRFMITTYDERGDVQFVSGKEIMKRRDKFNAVRAELQSKGTKSAKRVLKRLSGRENRWMTDVNHCLSKTLVDKYGTDTLFVLEDLTDVSFSEENLSKRNAKGRNETRSEYLSNDDRAGAMNIYQLGTMYVSLDVHPRYGARKTEKQKK